MTVGKRESTMARIRRDNSVFLSIFTDSFVWMREKGGIWFLGERMKEILLLL